MSFRAKYSNGVGDCRCRNKVVGGGGRHFESWREYLRPSELELLTHACNLNLRVKGTDRTGSRYSTWEQIACQVEQKSYTTSVQLNLPYLASGLPRPSMLFSYGTAWGHNDQKILSTMLYKRTWYPIVPRAFGKNSQP